ncbi:MAG: efflux RND transporter periplasmic adaptor subunit [Edaphobacter sp.]|uniref:efflux RND transporter periplasmic adaptor subunit n=1 Tax=Edaphobacter sp. TaxID=1934404 RepID=UPI00239E363C|nr:efflux RND transporter periplasmic adaptor subunit [Edaphobacter sp.]MDE1178713.1 efflux RND transporter periplasmic adaptor subunit [Edaphobacter sp.]
MSNQQLGASHIGPDHQLPEHAGGDSSERRGRKRYIYLIGIALLLVIGVVLLQHRKPTAAAPASGRRGGGGPVTITTATATNGNIGVYLNAIGTVTPVYTASLLAQASGVVVAVHYREGQMVHKGDPLIDIDPRIYQATLLQAQGTLEKDQSVLAQAAMDRDRYREAWKRNAIPKQTLDDQEKLVLQEQGTVKNDEGTVQYDQVELGYTHIVSPFTGRVGLRLVDPGNVVTAGGTTTLAVVTQVQPITVIFTLPEDQLAQVTRYSKHGEKLTVLAYDRTAKTKVASGTLLTLDNQIDTTTGTVKARAMFDNKDMALYPNEFLNTRLLVQTLDNVTLVPSSAVQHNGSKAFVYVVHDTAVAMTPVKEGVTESGHTQVTGLNAGAVVANSSFDKLQDKSKIVISHQPPPTETPESSQL